MILLYLLLGLLTLALLLLLAALLRTLLTPAKHSAYVPAPDPERAERYAQILARMVRCETVSDPGREQREKFLGFHRLLEELFPLVHEKLEKTEIDGNLLYYWRGESADKPIVLMSHQDVVPAAGEWLHGPFSGDLAEGKVWGRGASDTKCSVFGFFQAVEELLQEGYVPPQDVYLSSSCTEEFAGPGCAKLVAELKRRGVRPYLVCDEGGGIITDPVAGIKGSFAMMGVLEKGKADVKFIARSKGGHASAPPAGTPIARLAAFEHGIETRSPFKARFEPEVEAMFAQLAPYGSFGMRFLFGNLWLFRPLVLRVMPRISSQGGAMLKTTVAFTMQSGSDACNVSPQEAAVWANMRFIPHQGMEESLAVMEKLAQKHELSMEVIQASDYSPAADIRGPAWQRVVRTVEKTFPGLPTSPYVMTGATDARFYQEICDACIRFAPVVYGPEQMQGMHGLNENIEYACLPGAVDFYKNLIDAAREEDSL